MKMRKIAAFLMAACLVVSTSTVSAKAAELDSERFVDLGEVEVSSNANGEFSISDYLEAADAITGELEVSPEEMVRVIVVMEDEAILDKDSDATMTLGNKVRTSLMEMKQDSVVNRIEKKVFDGQSLEVLNNYTWLLNGVSVEVPYGSVNEIEQIDGVEKVLLEPVFAPAVVDETEADPNMYSSNEMTGAFDTWAAGYTGKGMKIAIVDTGLDYDHQNFAALPVSKLTKTSATRLSVNSVLRQLNAYSQYKEATGKNLKIGNVYYSTKIAYGFNYVDSNLTIDHSSDDQGDHGTHVAGIAAANEITEGEFANQAVGVAKDAQLYVMKVFGENGGAYMSDICAALEDALILGADVVNMSLGSPAGFTTDGEEYDTIFNKVRETKTVLNISAGNSATSGENNNIGLNETFSWQPDNATVGSPGTYASATTVASVDNAKTKAYYVEVAGNIFGYTEGSGAPNKPFNEVLGGQTLEYKIVGNLGKEDADFEGVAGKVAVIDRGSITFVEKCDRAFANGAVGVIIANNQAGTITMALTDSTCEVPAVSVTLEAGNALKANADENGVGTLFASEGQTFIPSATAYQISSFSSWGVAPNLTIEPDVAAPGGSIYSTTDEGTYSLMSGTSMASPNVAGISAVVAQYVTENYPKVTGAAKHELINSLITSTATPLEYTGIDGAYWSPRAEGAGLASAFNAVTAEAYIDVADTDNAKVNLYDDPEKTGKYDFEFDVVNFGTTDDYYELSSMVETELVNAAYARYGYLFMSEKPILLDDAVTVEAGDNLVLTYDYNNDGLVDTADARAYLTAVKADNANADEAFRYDVDGNEALDELDVVEYLNALVGNDSALDPEATVFKVAAGETQTVSVSVELSADDMAYMDYYFPYGIYVEGYTFVRALNANGVDLSVPFLGFYGDWTEAAILDDEFTQLPETEGLASTYPSTVFVSYGKNGAALGTNPVLGDEDGFARDFFAVSPNGDGYFDSIEEIYLGLLRNVNNLTVTYTDAETGEVYYQNTVNHVSKSVYSSSYGIVLPAIYSWYDDYKYDFVDAEGEVLANGTKLIMSITTDLDYDKHEQNNVSNTWELPIVVDTVAPTITKAHLFQDLLTGEYYLSCDMADDQGIAGTALLYYKDGAVTADTFTAEAVEFEDESYRVISTGENSANVLIKLSGHGNELAFVVADWADNETTVNITLPSITVE